MLLFLLPALLLCRCDLGLAQVVVTRTITTTRTVNSSITERCIHTTGDVRLQNAPSLRLTSLGAVESAEDCVKACLELPICQAVAHHVTETASQECIVHTANSDTFRVRVVQAPQIAGNPERWTLYEFLRRCVSARASRAEEVAAEAQISWLEWAEWLDCSRDCGGGVRGRERLCDVAATPAGSQRSCRQTQRLTCNTNPCLNSITFSILQVHQSRRPHSQVWTFRRTNGAAI